MSKISNVINMIRHLEENKNRYVKASELSELLGVNKRMIRHYKALLIDTDIIIESQKGRHGGYMLVSKGI